MYFHPTNDVYRIELLRRLASNARRVADVRVQANERRRESERAIRIEERYVQRQGRERRAAALLDWFSETRPEVVCLQGLKMDDSKVPTRTQMPQLPHGN